MTRLTTNDELRAAKRDWALAQCAREKAEVADLIIAAVRSTKRRVMDDLDNDSIRRVNQLRGVRRLAAALSDALAAKDPSFDQQAFLTSCGYGAN